MDNGLLKPDNNTGENAMRPVALGRKNWLFVGGERGGHATALYMSLIQSCKNCDVNPWEYLNDMLRRIMVQSGQSPQRNAARSMEAADSLADDKNRN